MNTWKTIQHHTYILLVVTGLTACSSLSHYIHTERYIAQFIGKSSQQIQKDINFSQLGISQDTPPMQQKNQLIYHIQRPMSIPIPMGHKVLDGKIANQSEYYDVNLSCLIIFQLNSEQIAESARYTGHAC